MITGGVGKSGGDFAKIGEMSGGMEITAPAEPLVAGPAGPTCSPPEPGKKGPGPKCVREYILWYNWTRWKPFESVRSYGQTAKGGE